MDDNSKMADSRRLISRRKLLGYALAGFGGCLLARGMGVCGSENIDWLQASPHGDFDNVEQNRRVFGSFTLS